MKISALSFVFALGIPLAYAVPPANDVCPDALEIDTTTDFTVAGDLTEATFDQLPYGWCGGKVEGPGVWYKIKNTFTGKVAITLSACIDTANAGLFISVLKGRGCDESLCVGGTFHSSDETCGAKTEFTFLASENDPIHYYILVSGYGDIGEFVLNVASDTSYFNVIDAANNRPVEVLNDHIMYEDIHSLSEKLNIEAVFKPELGVKSVKIQYDNEWAHCEREAPYSLFGDFKGIYFGKSMSLGTHTVTATPFPYWGCKGVPGTPMVKEFEVEGCDIIATIYDVNKDTAVDQVWGNYETASLPCKVNVEFIPFCGFEVKTLRVVMRNKETNRLVRDFTERLPPFFLFGDTRDDVLAGSIAPGSYTVTTFINGIEHYTTELIVGDEPCT